MAFDDVFQEQNKQNGTDEQELEQYGVWEKVGPEEISADDEGTIEDDYELHDLDSQEKSELTDEEEQLLGELEQQPGEKSGIETNLEDIDFDNNLDSDLEDLSFDVEDTTSEQSAEAVEIG